MAKINENIKKLRIEAGMTQKDLSILLGYKSPSTIAKIESGENAVDIPTAYQLAKFFHVSPSMLAGWTTDEKQEEQFLYDFRGLNRKWKEYIVLQMNIAVTMQEKEINDDKLYSKVIDEFLEE